MVCRLLALMLSVAGILPGAALAGQVCPPASLRDPLPGASEVSLSLADVSTAAYAGSWQEGVVGKEGLHYRLFADGTGSVASDLRMRGWHVDFTCDLGGKSCRYESHQSAPKKALEVAKQIGDCLIANPPRPKAKPADQGKRAARPETAVHAPLGKTGHPPALEPAKDPGAVPAKTPVVAAALAPKSAKLSAPVPDPAVDAPPPAARAATESAGPAAGPADRAKPGKVVKAAAPLPAKGAAPLPASAKGPKTPSAIRPAPGPTPAEAGATKAKAAARAAAKLAEKLPVPHAMAPARLTGAPLPDSAGVPAAPVTGGTSCGALRLPDETAPARVQRLLLLAGFDPGPIDGKWGAKTRAALAAALGADPKAEASAGAILRLEELLCAKSAPAADGPASTGQGGAGRCP